MSDDQWDDPDVLDCQSQIFIDIVSYYSVVNKLETILSKN